jgi:hypothetical protein
VSGWAAFLRAHAFALAAVAMLAMAVWQPPLLGAAERQNSAVLASAVAAYAVLRTINATVSTAKETTFGVGVIGSVETKPAMVLDPIDDTVRRIADVMFAVAAVSGLLAVGMAPVCALGAGVGALGFGGLYLAQFLPGPSGGWRRGCRALAMVGLVLGLLLPVGYGTGGWIGQALTETRLDAAMARLEASESGIDTDTEELTRRQAVSESADAATSGGDEGLMDGTLRWLGEGVRDAQDSIGGLVDRVWSGVPERNAIAARGEDILESSVDIMAVYALRLLVFPVLTLLVLYLAARAALSGRDGAEAGR